MQYGNVAYKDEPREELIGGNIVVMSPQPSVNHGQIIKSLHFIFGPYLKGKSCMLFLDNTDLYLSENNRFIPDFMVVCDRTKIKENGVHGAPDLVVEVLSPSTMRNDRTIKMDAYARAGVKEYWIISPFDRSIEQYFLENGSYILRDVYVLYPDGEIEEMTEDKRAEIVTHFKCHLFDDLDISVQEVFEEML